MNKKFVYTFLTINNVKNEIKVIFNIKLFNIC